jgi:putative NADH-flavin reductase
VTAIQRNGSNNKVADGIKSIHVDLTSKSDLIAAFKGQDVVVSAVPNPTLESERIIIDAAAEAGVTRIVPSEFSSNLEAKAKETMLPIVAEKLKVREYVTQAVSSGKIPEWSSINNGPFLDWGISGAFLGPNPRTRTAVFHNGGNKKITATSTDDIAKAVALMLQHPGDTKNKPVYVYSAYLSERQIRDTVSKLTGITEWDTEDRDVEADAKEYFDLVAKGENDPHKLASLYLLMMFGEGYGGDFSDVAMNKTIGLRVMDEKEVEMKFGEWLRMGGFGEWLL